MHDFSFIFKGTTDEICVQFLSYGKLRVEGGALAPVWIRFVSSCDSAARCSAVRRQRDFIVTDRRTALCVGTETYAHARRAN